MANEITRNYKIYQWVIQSERIPVGDVEGHAVIFSRGGSISVLDNGEVTTGNSVSIGDRVNLTGSYVQYSTSKYSDGSTIIAKITDINFTGSPGAIESAEWKTEFIHGTGRFRGIKGGSKGKTKYLPLVEGEAIQRSYAEATATYTLP